MMVLNTYHQQSLAHFLPHLILGLVSLDVFMKSGISNSVDLAGHLLALKFSPTDSALLLAAVSQMSSHHKI